MTKLRPIYKDIMTCIILLVLATLIFSGIANISGASVDDGKKIFDEKCSGCHEGKANVPSVSKISGLSEQDIVNKVRNGVPNTMMKPFPTDVLSESDLNNVIDYLKNSSSVNTMPSKTPGFDMSLGIFGVLFIYIIYNKKKW
jgi:mono/diheme cytochrome c family protein